MLQSRNFWAAVVLLSVFWPVAWFLPLDWLFDIMNSLAIAACVALVIVYGPGLRHFLMRNDLDGAHYLVAGIAGFGATQAIRYTWNWLWRLFDKPHGFLDSVWLAYVLWISILCALMHLMARNVIRGHIPNENYKTVGIVVGVGIALSLLVISFLEN